VYFLVLVVALLFGLDLVLVLVLVSSRRPRCHVLVVCFHTCIVITFRAASLPAAPSIPFLTSTVYSVDDLETRQPRRNA
jgi:hypothetical protein